MRESRSWNDQVEPDLNHTEKARQYLKTRVQEAQSTSAETMKVTLKKEWISLDYQYCCTLVESMPSHLQRMLEVKGDLTKY